MPALSLFIVRVNSTLPQPKGGLTHQNATGFEPVDNGLSPKWFQLTCDKAEP
ncbi:MAG: hypothetical protein K0R61_1395 [Microvirga sp.]|jgi:hypothetical protein|nr:hypothetical protein [Microvirga sp.]MCD6071410.1 hypothetical protein [Microvirga sp.]MDF2687453.1 hypothetical protein [Microvirga sp.]MDF2970945.1 hypothetical protein [Microvirga sp.]